MKLFGLFLWLFAILQVSAARNVTKRAILKDLSQGFCRSYKFAGMQCCIKDQKRKKKKKTMVSYFMLCASQYVLKLLANRFLSFL
jgi:hypothetical protein